MQADQLLSVEQAATEMGCHPESVRRLVRRGNATRGRSGLWPTYRPLGRIRIPRSTLAAYLEATVDR
jgi:excisionase family DNA binding protein